MVRVRDSAERALDVETGHESCLTSPPVNERLRTSPLRTLLFLMSSVVTAPFLRSPESTLFLLGSVIAGAG